MARITAITVFSMVVLASAELPHEIDWIIVGGGAAGCTAAAALVDAHENVLLVERGPSNKAIASTQSGHTWSEVVAEAVENIRWVDGAWGGVAKVLGGGASVNDGYFFEETPDFVAEHLQLKGADVDAFFASSAWLADRMLTPLPASDYGKAFADATEMAGHGTTDFTDEANIRYKEGGWVVRSLFNHSDPHYLRNSPANLLHERAGMSNLQVATDSLATKVLFNGNKAIGVLISEARRAEQSVMARKGVILSAGAVYTPQLLQVSGVGEADLLAQLGVEQVVDLPVGRNFVDRLTWTVQMLTPKMLNKHLGYTVTVDGGAGLTFESVGGKGVDRYMAIPSLGLAPAKQRNAALRPLMKGLMEGPVGDFLDGFTNVLALVHDTKSRGSVTATSKDTSQPPSVFANFFNVSSDLDKQIANLKALIHIANQAPVKEWRMTNLNEPIENLFPEHVISSLRRILPDLYKMLDTLGTCKAVGFVSTPCPPEDESKWGQWLKDNVLSTYHYFGTAAVGSVVEAGTFKVYGTESLYVVDASVIPRATRVNPVGTIMTLGHFMGTKLAADRTWRGDGSRLIV